MGTDFSFRIHVNMGAGAFVCGEGSALTASIEGNRGMPRVKPPRTIEHGLWAEPTVLNNVETFANVPLIIRNGVDWYRSIGTETSPGTKAFALTGNVVNTGLIEVPMGTTIREVVFDIGGGIRDGKKFKAVQIGGPSGGATTASKEHLDLPLDFDSLKSIGAMIGSGGLGGHGRGHLHGGDRPVLHGVYPEGVLRQVRPLPGGHQADAGDPGPHHRTTRALLEDLDLLEELADTISLHGPVRPGAERLQAGAEHAEIFPGGVSGPCGGPPLSHLQSRKSPTPPSTRSKCKGCGKCRKNCPMEAISGAAKQAHVIDPEKCINCGACVTNCPFGAIAASKEG